VASLLSQPAIWGAAGAFIYAAPLFSTCVFTSRAAGGSCARCSVELVTALAIGTLSAAAMAPLIQELSHRETAAWLRAVSAMTGLLANKFAPMIVSAAPGAATEWFNRMFKRSDPK
jgi:hypothetical protein